MAQHVVRRGAASPPARRPEALPTAKLSEEEVRSLLIDHARATESAALEPGEPASSTAGTPRFAHTLRRDLVAPAVSPAASSPSIAPPTSPADDRTDIATIAMPRLKRPSERMIALPPSEDVVRVATATPIPPVLPVSPTPATTEAAPPAPRRLAGGRPRLPSRPRTETALPAPRLMATDAIEPLALPHDAVATPLDHAPSLLAVEPQRPTAPGVRRWLVVLPIAVLLIIVGFAVVSGLARVIFDALRAL